MKKSKFMRPKTQQKNNQTRKLFRRKECPEKRSAAMTEMTTKNLPIYVIYPFSEIGNVTIIKHSEN